MPKVKVEVTIAEQIFRTYRKVLEIDTDATEPEEQTFDEWFCDDEGEVFQDNVNDRDYSLQCPRCKHMHEPCSQDVLSPYCDNCQEELAEANSGIHAGAGI